jgi:hypothetical protein
MTRAPVARPERIEPAFDDFAAVRDLVGRAGPYANLAGSSGYAGYRMASMPWFRSMWATDGRLLRQDAVDVLHNRPFVESSRRVFDAEIVRPHAIVVNLMGPMPAGVPHLDIPTFRGLEREKASPWLLSIIASSGLFEPWAVRVAGAICWFYTGDGAGYEYWPDGPTAPSSIESGPFGNVALVGDNDLMFHRVRAIGDPGRYAAAEAYGGGSAVDRRDGAWVVTEDGTERARYPDREMRVSILWRGLVFPDGTAEHAFDAHLDDLDDSKIVDRFLEDLDTRGTHIGRPTDIVHDPAWVETLNATYGFPGFDPADS